MGDGSFERGLSSPRERYVNRLHEMYTRESVMRYRADDIDEVINDSTKLLQMIRHHKSYQVPRLEALEDYYLGNNTGILTGERRVEKEKTDHRVRHSFAATISNFLNSYTIGNPIKIISNNAGETESSDWLEVVEEFNNANDIHSHNIEIGSDQNNMGRAYELIVRNENDEDRIYQLDPTEVFMIYDRTVRSRVIGACRYFEYESLDDSENVHMVELYTPEKVIRYLPANVENDQKLTVDEDNSEEHLFYGVPIIEYRSNRYRMGIYEREIPIIDAYDSAQSDTANYMTDFNDAILLLQGDILGADDPKYLKAMKDANILAIVGEQGFDGKPTPTSASYLTKSYDVAGVEAYKKRLRSDIFNLSNVPDLSDDSFAGNQSGEALKYKMFGIQQKRIDKERYLVKGMRVRYKLLANIKQATSEYTADDTDLDFVFTPNLPKAYLEELKAFVASGGEVSQRTMLELLSFIDSAEAELEQIAEEREQQDESRKSLFDALSDDFVSVRDESEPDIGEDDGEE